MTARRTALLLSGSIGMGHDALAAACTTSLESQGWTTSTLDAMKMLGRRSGPAGEAVFRAMLGVPGLYDAFHYSALRMAGSRGSPRPGQSDSLCPSCAATLTSTLPIC